MWKIANQRYAEITKEGAVPEVLIAIFAMSPLETPFPATMKRNQTMVRKYAVISP